VRIQSGVFHAAKLRDLLPSAHRKSCPRQYEIPSQTQKRHCPCISVNPSFPLSFISLPQRQRSPDSEPAAGEEYGDLLVSRFEL